MIIRSIVTLPPAQGTPEQRRALLEALIQNAVRSSLDLVDQADAGCDLHMVIRPAQQAKEQP